MNRLLVYLAITTIILLCVWKIGYDRSATSSNVEQVALDGSSAGPLLPASMRSMLDNPVDAGDGSGSFGQRITNVTFPTDPTDPNSVFISTSETLNSTFRTDIDQWLPTKFENRIYRYNDKTQQLERLYATTTDGHTSFGIKNIAARKAILARDGVRLVIYSNCGHGGPCIDPWLADNLAFLDLIDPASGLQRYVLGPAERAAHQAQQDACFSTI